MNFYISHCCFQGDLFPEMEKLPKEFGIEIQIDYGSGYYWDAALARVMKDREGGLSIHGPFVNIDLSSETLDEKMIMEYHKWSFDLYNRHNAKHFAIHPDGKLDAHLGPKELDEKRKRALDRIAMIADLAKRENVNLLVENIRSKGYGLLFDTEEFIDLFRQIPDVDCLIDTGHLRLSNWSAPYVLSELGDRIQAYHINDTFGLLDEHTPLGRGCIDWVEFFDAYKKYTPEAEFVLEYKGCTTDDMVASANLVKALMR